MKEFLKTIFSAIVDFMSNTAKRRLLWVGILSIATLTQFLILGLARRTFVFYTVTDGVVVVEDRMLKHASTREGDVIRYMEEVLLGPVSLDLLPLFPRETRLKSLLYREGVVYADFTESAVLPPMEGGEALVNFRTLHDGILRNFSYVNDVRFFIEGTAIYADEFLHEETGSVFTDLNN